MTTYVDFPLGSSSPVQFSAVLDGAAYAVQTQWNLYGQRWYVSCKDVNGDVIFLLPLIASPDGYDISLTAGYFQTPLVYRESTQRFELQQ